MPKDTNALPNGSKTFNNGVTKSIIACPQPKILVFTISIRRDIPGNASLNFVFKFSIHSLILVNVSDFPISLIHSLIISNGDFLSLTSTQPYLSSQIFPSKTPSTLPLNNVSKLKLSNPLRNDSLTLSKNVAKSISPLSHCAKLVAISPIPGHIVWFTHAQNLFQDTTAVSHKAVQSSFVLGIALRMASPIPSPNCSSSIPRIVVIAAPIKPPGNPPIILPIAKPHTVQSKILFSKPFTQSSTGRDSISVSPKILSKKVRKTAFNGDTFPPKNFFQIEARVNVAIALLINSPEFSSHTVIKLVKRVEIKSPNGPNIFPRLPINSLNFCNNPLNVISFIPVDNILSMSVNGFSVRPRAVFAEVIFRIHWKNLSAAFTAARNARCNIQNDVTTTRRTTAASISISGLYFSVSFLALSSVALK